MKTLPHIKGLLAEAALRKRGATDLARRSAAAGTCPREAHECRVSADAEARIAGELEAIAADDIDLLVQIEALVEWLGKSKMRTPGRTLAMRDLESASGRLRREVGDAPAGSC